MAEESVRGRLFCFIDNLCSRGVIRTMRVIMAYSLVHVPKSENIVMSN